MKKSLKWLTTVQDLNNLALEVTIKQRLEREGGVRSGEEMESVVLKGN